MDSFEIRVKPSVEKDLRRLPKTLISRILEEIENLRSDPFPHGAINYQGLTDSIAFE